MRVGGYIAVSAKDLRRQVVRSLLTITALAISAAILVTIVAITLRGQQAIIGQFGDESLSLITVTANQGNGALSPYGSVQEINKNTTNLNDDAVRQLSALPNVISASPRVGIWELNHFQIDKNTKQFAAQAQGIPFDAPLLLEAGDVFKPDQKNVVIVGRSYAAELGYAPKDLIGKTVQLTTQKGYRGDGASLPSANASQQVNEAFAERATQLTATIVGITKNGPDQNTLLLPIEWARAIRTAQYPESTGVKRVDQIELDGYSAVRVDVDNAKNVNTVSESIKQAGYGQISAKQQLERLEQFTSTVWIILGSIAFIAVIAATLGVANTMLMAVSEQNHTIAVWRAVGARRIHIMKLFLVQALWLGLIGGVIGAGIGSFASNYINTYISSILSAQGLVSITEAVLPLWLPLGAVALTMFFAAAAGFYPAFKAAKADPSAALRSN